MPDMSWATRGAATAERMRRLIRRRGMTGNGHPLWTKREIDTVKHMVPGYAPIVKKLKRRTYYAVKAKAQQLGLAPKRHQWTAAEVSKLKRLYPSASQQEIKSSFPDFSFRHLAWVARYHGSRRKRRAFAPTGIIVIDQIRARAFELNYSMVDLDAMISKRCTYFQKANWQNYVDHKKVGRIVRELGGKLTVEWEE